MPLDEGYNFLTTFFNTIRGCNSEEIFILCKETVNQTRIHPNEEAIDRAEALVIDGILHEQKLLTSYTFQYKDWDNPEAVIITCEKLQKIFDSQQCDYTNSLERYKFCGRAFDFFAWMLDGIRYSVVMLDPTSPNIQSSIKFLTTAMKDFISKPFYCLLVYTYIHHSRRKISKEALLMHANAVVKEREKFVSSEEGKTFMEYLEHIPEYVQKAIDGPRGRVVRPNFCTLPESHPGVLTLGTIFSCFNVIESDLEVAETFLVFSHTVGIPRVEMLFDLLRVGPLIQVNDSNFQRNSLVEVFVYLRIPNIIKLLVNELGVKKESLLLALKKFVKLRSLLNTVDLKTSTHYVQHLLKALHELDLIALEDQDSLLQIRNAEIATKPKLEFLLSGDILPESSLKKTNLAEQIAFLIRKAMTKEDEKFLGVIEKFLFSTDGMMERACAILCCTDELRNFALRLAKINQTSENHSIEMSHLRNSRLSIYDMTFLLLVRIRYVFKDLRITLTQPELEQSRFFSWWEVYEKGLIENLPMTSEETNKNIFINQYSILKQGEPFWNDTDEVGSIIDMIPGIGELILDDFKRGWPQIDQTIRNCLKAFQKLPCIFVCFIQWLETETPITDTIRDFSRKVHSVCLETLSTAPKTWAFAIYSVDPAIQHLINRTPDAPYHVKSFLLTIAHRVMPKTHFMQAPDKLVLKDVYYIAIQQGWATPDVIELCSNAAQTLNYRRWILCWLEQLMKNSCTDEVIAACELILATLFLRPVTALAEITQKIMDFLFVDHSAKPFPNQISLRAFAWLVVRAKVLLIFAEQTRREKESNKKMLREKSQQNITEMVEQEKEDGEGPPAKKSRNDAEPDVDTVADRSTSPTVDFSALFELEQSTTIFDEDKSGEIRQDFELDDEPLPPGTDWPLSKKIHKVNEKAFMNLSNIVPDPTSISIITISISLRRIEKQIKIPIWRKEIARVITLARELGRIPRSRFWYKLVRVLVKPQFFQQLARIEPFAIPLDEMIKLYDIRDNEQLEHLLFYACLLRRFGAV